MKRGESGCHGHLRGTREPAPSPATRVPANQPIFLRLNVQEKGVDDSLARVALF